MPRSSSLSQSHIQNYQNAPTYIHTNPQLYAQFVCHHNPTSKITKFTVPLP
ncbi:hypothetical protein Hanom_Chr05g00475221 [Helianthus anomalus]